MRDLRACNVTFRVQADRCGEPSVRFYRSLHRLAAHGRCRKHLRDADEMTRFKGYEEVSEEEALRIEAEAAALEVHGS